MLILINQQRKNVDRSDIFSVMLQKSKDVVQTITKQYTDVSDFINWAELFYLAKNYLVSYLLKHLLFLHLNSCVQQQQTLKMVNNP